MLIYIQEFLTDAQAIDYVLVGMISMVVGVLMSMLVSGG